MEYLLGVHPTKCRSVMSRVLGQRAIKTSSPEYQSCGASCSTDWPWTNSIPDVRAALRRELRAKANRGRFRKMVGDYCLECLTARSFVLVERRLRRLSKKGVDPSALRLVRHQPAQLLLGADRVSFLLSTGRHCRCLETRLPRDLVREIARIAAAEPRLLDRLAGILASGRESSHATPATPPNRASISDGAEPSCRIIADD